MFLRKYWIGLTVFLMAIVGVGILYYLQTRPPKDPIIIYKATNVEKQPKPPPPGETYETGHWHGDEWHSGSHDAPTPVEPQPVEVSEVKAERTEMLGAPVVAESMDAQIIEQAAQAGDIKLFDKRTPEYYKAVAAWKEWNKKFDELHVLDMEAGQMLIDALPTKEEAKQYENDEQFKKEMGRKVNEASKRIGEVTKMRRDHEAKKPPFPYLR